MQAIQEVFVVEKWVFVVEEWVRDARNEARVEANLRIEGTRPWAHLNRRIRSLLRS